MTRDPRLTPARGDVAALFLRGEVEAERFVEGVAHQGIFGCTPILAAPSATSRRETELLFGEMFQVYDFGGGFAWGQAAVDSYVGYVPAAALDAAILQPTHRVSAVRTAMLESADIKAPLRDMLSLNARVSIEDHADGNAGDAFARIARGGFVAMRHLAPIDAAAEDFVSVAERMLGLAYVWGGRGALGVDCSGLVQTALAAAGIAAPRDTDMQERALGTPIAFDATFSNLRRGDLVFWDGHMGVMIDSARLLHANSHHMLVAIEPLQDAAARMAQSSGPIRSIRRL